MAKNDVVLIDAILDERIAQGYPSNQRDEVFELLALEQVLKDFDLSREEIEVGWVDGRDDGGIDGLYIFINGRFLQDPSTFSWPKRNAEITVIILTCKHHETFQQSPLNTLVASLSELLDLSLEKPQLRGKYSDELLRSRSLLYAAYRRLSVARPTLNLRLAYVSRGDSSVVAPNVRARSEQLEAITRNLFSDCTATFEFIGAAELVALYRQTKSFSLELPVVECLTRESGSYVALTRLDDYGRFVTDSNGNLRRYLFDSNVRDYLGENRVNEDIQASLVDPDAPEFWWLNNGVTFLATSAMAIGKILHLKDVQIVNGLQTTESIFRHFASGSVVSAERTLLVKVVVSSDPAIRDQIIRATNNQSLVELSSLHATDKVQRDIEDILERHDWYYERRKNYYRNIGKPPARFVSPMYLAAGYVALVMKNPALAARLKARFMRTEQGYSSVFSTSVPLQTWVAITEVLKRVEDALSNVRPPSGEGERFLAKWRNLIAFLAVARLLGRFSYSVVNLADLDPKEITPDLAIEMWRLVQTVPQKSLSGKASSSLPYVQKCCGAAASAFGLADIQVVGLRRPGLGETDPRPRPAVTEEFVLEVDKLLPAQPWKPRVHAAVALQLGCMPNEVSAAIQQLIERGARQRQKDGVVFDASGQIVAIDVDRGKVPSNQG